MSSSIDTAAIAIAKNLEDTESLLLKAYVGKFPDIPEGATKDQLEQEKHPLVMLANNLGVSFEEPAKDLSLRGLQLVAEQRYQQKSQAFSLFSNILGKADQLKQQIIQRMGR